MLKTRIIAVLNVRQGIVVQSINFNQYLPIGIPEISVEYLNSWGIDEIICLDIDATKEKREPNLPLIRNISKKCFVPLTFGGGVNKISQIKDLIRNGADKIVLNNSSVKRPKLIKKASEIFGNQCIIVSIDARKIHGGYEVFLESGTIPTGMSPIDLAIQSEKLGAGEILINSIDKDGSKMGYDLPLIKSVAESVSIPVIACGGVGHPTHFLEGIKHSKATAVAAGNYFHFTEHSPIVTKSFLANNYTQTRIDTQSTYQDFEFNPDGRINKRADRYLDKIRFEYEHEEII